MLTICSNKECTIKDCLYNFAQVERKKSITSWVTRDLDGSDSCYKVEKFKNLSKFGF